MRFTAKLIGFGKDFRSGRFRITIEPTECIDCDALTALDETVIDAELTRHRERRSLSANALLWHCIGQIAQALNADKWDIYLLMLRRYGKFTYICVKPSAVEAIKRQWRESETVGEVNINGSKAVQMLCYYGSSTYDTKEMSTLIDGVVSELKEMGLEPPMPGEIRRAMERFENEQNRKTSQI